ncbi:MAG: zinc-binding alcohol dehydrogenase family protein [Burkholderiaceae bacterium]|nr:zinc-binding alcohol dehydrogenase family protein [Burkholderiaceae bacterium]
MRAIGCMAHAPGASADALVALELPRPEPGPGDLRVRVRAVGMNPLDTRLRGAAKAAPDKPRILGWDAAGVVDAIGPGVQGFALGDRVLYAGSVLRPGCNSEWQCVDARLVGKMPEDLSFAEAAALPVAGLTAWEMLFDRFGLVPGAGAGQCLLVLGGAGGVASMAIALARHDTRLQVVATASRPESQAWVRAMGAHAVLSHAQDLVPQCQALGLPPFDYAFSMATRPAVWQALTEWATPQGKIGFIDEPGALDLNRLRGKSLSVHAEGLFTRGLHQTPDMARQGAILTELAQRRAQNRLPSSVGAHLGPLSVATLREAHRLQESRQVCGKIVLGGWPDA